MTVSVWLIYLGLFLDCIVGQLCLETSHLPTHSSHLASYHTLNVCPKWCILLRKNKGWWGWQPNVYQYIFQWHRRFTRRKKFPQNSLFLPEIYLHCKSWTHFPPQSKQIYFILGQFCLVLSHRYILWQFPSITLLAWHSTHGTTECHNGGSIIQGHPRASKNLISGVLGSFLPTPAWESPSTDTKPGWGVRACSVPREKSNVLQFLVVTRNNTLFSPLCSVISLQLRLLNAFMDPGQDIFSNRYWNRLFHEPVL